MKNSNSPFKDLDAGKPTGLYHLIIGEGQNAFVGNGKSLNENQVRDGAD